MFLGVDAVHCHSVLQITYHSSVSEDQGREEIDINRKSLYFDFQHTYAYPWLSAVYQCLCRVLSFGGFLEACFRKFEMELLKGRRC